jgi:hypothetical protein
MAKESGLVGSPTEFGHGYACAVSATARRVLIVSCKYMKVPVEVTFSSVFVAWCLDSLPDPLALILLTKICPLHFHTCRDKRPDTNRGILHNRDAGVILQTS